MGTQSAYNTWPTAPFLTEADIKLEAEGSIDPLGLAPISTRLANKLVPGVVERHQNPRYLTAMAVGNIVCSDFGPHDVAVDERSPPWQVYEWYTVTGLTRTAEQRDKLDAIRGLPGREKARAALKLNIPLSAGNYLKTPSVFGFHGVYRGLGEALGLIDDYGLGSEGRELLDIWEKEQGLQGFTSGQGVPGGKQRDILRRAIQDGMEKAEVARSKAHWGNGWAFFFDHLRPFSAGQSERRFLWRTLMTPSDNLRAQILDFVVSAVGKELLETMHENGEISERQFHKQLHTVAGSELRSLLDAIDAYERFSRLITDAFYDCLTFGAEAQRPVSVSELAGVESVKVASANIAEAIEKTCHRLDTYDEAIEFRKLFTPLAEPTDASNWIQALLDHHEATQRRKPPSGKAPWIENHGAGQIMVRPQYRERGAGRGDQEYVGLYRTGSLWSMARDLQKAKS